MVTTESIREKLNSYLEARYGDKVDMNHLPLNGGLMNFLGIDSMASLEMLVDMESVFNIEINDEVLSFDLADNINHMVDVFTKLSQGKVERNLQNGSETN